jgi:hypothetical protein
MLSDLSHRYLSLPQLADASNLRRNDVRAFIEMLDARGLLIERESLIPDSMFWSLRPLGGWLRRAMSSTPGGR